MGRWERTWTGFMARRWDALAADWHTRSLDPHDDLPPAVGLSLRIKARNEAEEAALHAEALRERSRTA